MSVQEITVNHQESVTSAASIRAEASSKVHPGRRFLARMLDMYLFSFLAGFALGLFAPEALALGEEVLGVLIFIAFIPVEAAILAAAGTTVGKALFDISLVNRNGTSLTFDQALNRSFNVWLRGMALGLPLLMFGAELVAYRTLTQKGITSWDLEGGYTVHHRPLGAIRVVLISCLFLTLGYLMFFWSG